MDNEISVGTQYIICECGDNFPNENFLNIHLANNHGDVEAFQCDACPELFTSINALSRHTITHHSQKTEKPKIKIPGLKTYSRKPPKEVKEERKEVEVKKVKEVNEVKEVKKPPVIKLKNLKRIDSISLIENLKSFGGFIKLEPSASVTEPDPEPVPEPQPELEEAVQQVIVKNEAEAGEENEGAEEIYYQCDVCNSIFYTEWDFNIHYQSAHALKLEPSAEQILERHLVTDHGDDEGVKAEADTAYYYECELCHKIFASEKYFNIHYNKTHGGLLPVEEAENEEDTSEANGEVMEVEEAKPKVPEQVIYYKCDLCKILYPSEKVYNTHFDKNHGGQSCGEIQTGFRLIEQELSDNARYDPPLESLEGFTCEFCPKTFTMKRSLAVHRKRVHTSQLPATEPVVEAARSANRSKVCDVCGRAYNSNAALRYHQRRHTGEKPYPCTICPKRFTMPMFLQIHMRTHTGEKPYECPHCPKAFTNKAALIRHDRVHTGVKPYACPECGKLFTQSNSMKLHVSTVHLKLPAPYKSKSRRNKSEARALQLALKSLPADEQELVLGE